MEILTEEIELTIRFQQHWRYFHRLIIELQSLLVSIQLLFVDYDADDVGRFIPEHYVGFECHDQTVPHVSRLSYQSYVISYELLRHTLCILLSIPARRYKILKNIATWQFYSLLFASSDVNCVTTIFELHWNIQ